MIKFLAKIESGNMLGIGLSERNVELLKEGKPIKIDLDEMITPAVGIQHTELTDLKHIFIFYGTTEEQMAHDLKDVISSDTLVHRFDDRHDRV